MTTATPSSANPVARRDVVFRKTGDEWLLFDPATGRIHVLNLAAALIWSSLDGTRSEEALVAEVAHAFPEPADPGADRSAEVAEALARFREEGLLEEG